MWLSEPCDWHCDVKGRKSRKEQMFPSTHPPFLSSGMGKARGQRAPAGAKAHHRKQTLH